MLTVCHVRECKNNHPVACHLSAAKKGAHAGPCSAVFRPVYRLSFELEIQIKLQAVNIGGIGSVQAILGQVVGGTKVPVVMKGIGPG
jgi:hypothetical protein